MPVWSLHPLPSLVPSGSGQAQGQSEFEVSGGFCFIFLFCFQLRPERLPFHFSLSCIGEGNGNPLQCSCLENPRDGGAWWAAVYGVAQSQTWLKRLSSSRPKWAERLGEAPLFRGVVLDSKAVSSAFQMKQRKCENPTPPDSSLGQSPGDQISKHLTHSS